MNIKHTFLALLFIFFATSCTNRELYKQTDYFVEELYSTYQSYGLFGITKYEKFTPDGKYKVAPIGRLINVRIQDHKATRKDYEDLKNDLLKHYKNDSRVNDVYICGAGTIMIDCRN